ncbi:MAG: group III truncated hemoglobin [Rhodospirillaceae bacterium]
MTEKPPGTEKASGTYAAWQPVDPSEHLSEDDITRLVHTFYDKIRDHAELGPIFDKSIDDWGPHLSKMVDFWASMMLGVKRYDGRPLPAHMKMPDLRDHHFGQWLVLFRQTCEELFEPAIAAQFIERAERIAQSFRYAMQFAPDRAREAMPLVNHPPHGE